MIRPRDSATPTAGQGDSATNTVRYLQSVTVTDLAPDEDRLVEFPLWDVPAQPEGRYYATAWTVLSGDIDVHNDTARGDFAVEAKQQGPPAWTRLRENRTM